MLLRVLFIYVAAAMLLAPLLALAGPRDARWHTFTSDNGLAGNIVQAIWQDPQGGVWFGTENGVSHYDGRAWKTYRTSDGLVDNNVWFISGDADSVWFATSNGVSRYDGRVWSVYTERDGLPNNDVRAVLVARDGVVWAGMFGGGIARKAPESARWQQVDIAEIDPALASRVRNRDVIVSAVSQAPSGQIWFSTNGVGALQLNAGRWVRYDFKIGSRNTVWSIGAGAGSDTSWIGTFRGIVRVQGERAVAVDQIVHGVAISQTEILAVAEQDADSVWFGTRAQGVFHVAGDIWERFTTDNGLARNYVQTILADRSGRVWFGTRGGGVTLLDRQPPRPEMLRAVVTGRDIQHNREIRLKDSVLDFDQNNLEFTFSAPIDWLPAQELSFRYWLERAGQGADAPKVARAEAGTGVARSEVDDFINLSPGSYTLHVAPAIGAVEGREQLYPFMIRRPPPSFSAAALTVSSDGMVIQSGATLAPVLFDSIRRVQIDFVLDNNTAPADRLAYEYRIAGQEAAWSRVAGHSATLLLPQGTYEVEMRAIAADGTPSAPVRIPVIVPRPFWITVLGYLAIIIVPGVLGGAGGAFWYRRWSQRQALLRAVRGHLIPYDVGPLITAPERYIGRQHVLDTILGRIDNNSFYVYGEKRIGKTSLLAQLKWRLAQRNELQSERVYIPVFRNIQDVPQEKFWIALIRGIADEVPGVSASLVATTRPAAEYNDFDAQDDLELMTAQFQVRFAPRRPLLVLLLDEVDTLQRYDPIIRQRFRAFCQHMQERLQVVLVGVLPPRAEVSETSPWYNIFAPIVLEPLDRSDMLFLIRSYNQNPYAYTAEAEQALLAAGDRKPFDTQWLCSESVKAMLADKRTRVVLADVEQAIRVVIGERRREYATFWQHLPVDRQGDLREARHQGGALPPDRVALGDYDRLFEAGLALKLDGEYQLAHLFSRWLEESL
jgi:hypothetical protein